MSHRALAIDSSAHPQYEPFSCEVLTGQPDTVVLRAGGELDVASAPELDRALRELPARMNAVTLDLRAVTFIDTCAVHAVVGASVRAQQGNQPLVIRATPQIDRVFALTGQSAHLQPSSAAETRQDMVAAAGAAPSIEVSRPS